MFLYTDTEMSCRKMSTVFPYLFKSYLTHQQSSRCKSVRLVNDELQSVWEEVVVA